MAQGEGERLRFTGLHEERYRERRWEKGGGESLLYNGRLYYRSEAKVPKQEHGEIYRVVAGCSALISTV